MRIIRSLILKCRRSTRNSRRSGCLNNKFWRRKSVFIISSIIIFIIACFNIISAVHPRSISKPNVILITIDALRPDHLGCYGYKRATSPNIDSLAKEGVIFMQSISQASVTCVSLPSLFTSVYPTRLGIVDQAEDIKKEFRSPCFTEVLKGKNYRTAVFLPDRATIMVPEWTKKGADLRLIYRNSDGKSDYPLLTRQVTNWIAKDLKRSFFLWIHYRGVHTPYRPPAPYNSLFVHDKFYDGRKKAPLVDNPGGWGGIMPKVNLNNIRETDYYISHYDGALKYVDYWVGELVSFLKQRGIYEDTIVIISADHGEAFGEHNLYFEHGNTLYDELLRVPLIIKFAKGEFRGKRLLMQVRSIDIMPTIMEYLQFESPRGTDGESLLALIENKETSGKTIFSFSKTGLINAVRSADWKLISYDDKPAQYELYNLKEDPGELHNVYAKNAGIAKRLTYELGKHKSEFSRASLKRGEDNSEMMEVRRILHSLGYLQ
ncbi:DUF4976 domain-containing protein [bacterium]|nr:MAG: DUF4976 domain-containing protein [bacterium]